MRKKDYGDIVGNQLKVWTEKRPIRFCRKYARRCSYIAEWRDCMLLWWCSNITQCAVWRWWRSVRATVTTSTVVKTIRPGLTSVYVAVTLRDDTATLSPVLQPPAVPLRCAVRRSRLLSSANLQRQQQRQLSPFNPFSSTLYVTFWLCQKWLYQSVQRHTGLSARIPECQQINKGGLDQYGDEHLKCNHLTLLGLKGLM